MGSKPCDLRLSERRGREEIERPHENCAETVMCPLPRVAKDHLGPQTLGEAVGRFYSGGTIRLALHFMTSAFWFPVWKGRNPCQLWCSGDLSGEDLPTARMCSGTTHIPAGDNEDR